MRTLFVLVAILVVAVTSYAVGRLQSRLVIEPRAEGWVGNDATAQAWQKLLVSVEDTVARVTEEDDADEAGLAYIADLVSAALEMKVAGGDPQAPRFTDWMASGRKFLGDSPDARYHSAEVSGRYRYRISGNRGGADYLGVMTYGRGLNGWNRAAASLSLADLTIDDAGNFEIIASRTAPQPAGAANWLPLEDDIHMIMVRQYFYAPENTRGARLKIERLDGQVDDAELAAADRIENAAQFVTETFRGTRALTEMLRAYPNNPEPPPSYNQSFGGIFYPTHDNTYLGTWFKLADGEVLVVEGDVPDALYWSASLQNRWLQSLASPAAALNNTQLHVEEGRYQLVVSAHDPGVPNWLDTGGATEGLLAIRFLVEARKTKPPTMRIAELPLAVVPHHTFAAPLLTGR